MYGTIARFRMKPGMEQQLEEFSRQEVPQIPGFVFQHVYRMDADSNEYYLVVAFESREAYQANATSSEQHERYRQIQRVDGHRAGVARRGDPVLVPARGRGAPAALTHQPAIKGTATASGSTLEAVCLPVATCLIGCGGQTG